MSTIIIAAIVTAITIALPVVFGLLNRKNATKRSAENLRLFNLAASNNGLSFSKQEVLKNKIIGLDRENEVVLAYEFANSNIIQINLKDVSNCNINKQYESINIGSDKKVKLEKELRSIDLAFTFKGNAQQALISFYNSSFNSVYEMAELEAKAKEWQDALSSMVTKESRVIA